MKFFRFLFVALALISPASAWRNGAAQYTFNGGRSQLNMGLLGINECPFINMVKCMGYWANGGTPIDPGSLNVNGYPTSGAYNSVIALPDQENLTRNVLVTWVGNGVLSPSSGSVVSGSINPVLGGDGIYRGRYVYTPSGSSVRAGMASQGSPPVSQISVLYADLETTFNTGEIFDPVTINLVRNTLRVGTVRFLNWQGFSNGANGSNVTTFESLKSENYFSWSAGEFRNIAATNKPALWAGTTTNGAGCSALGNNSQDYCVTFGSGGPSDKQMLQLKFNASATQTITTLGSLSSVFTGAVSSDMVVHWTAHGLSVGEAVGFIGSTGTPLPGPMGSGINYYVSNVIDANNFNISLTSGGSNLVRTSTGTTGSTISAIRMPTLNLNSTGAVPVRINTGDPGGFFGGTQPTINKLNTLVYDADLASWMLFEGTSDFGGIINGVPPSIMLRFCMEVGAHCWFVTPFLAADPMTNFAASLSAYVKASKPSWMKFRLEGINELWNTGSAFLGTRYAWNKSFIHWGTNFDNNNWYGKTISTIGQDLQTTFAGDTTQYDVMGCVQASTGDNPTVNNDRFNSTQYVAQAAAPQSGYLKQPAYKYVTQGCEAMYIQSNWYGFPPELSYAYDYAVNGNATALQNYVDGLTASGSSTQNLVRTGTRYAALGPYFAGPWGSGPTFALGMMAYEGGANAIAPSSTNNSSAITGATQDASGCVLTLPNTFVNSNQNGSAASNSPTPAAMVGMTLSISGVVGMTQLNGNTYTVTGINVNTGSGPDPTKVRINVDSSGFSLYTSGGTAVYVNGNTWLTTLRAAFRLHASMQNYTYGGAASNYQNWLNAGGTFPSHFDFSSASSPWALYQPDQYTATPSPQAAGIAAFNHP